MTHLLHSWALKPVASNFAKLRAVVQLGVFLVLLLALQPPASGLAAKDEPAKVKPCAVTELNFDNSVNANSFDEQYAAIAALLREEKFDDLDCIADSARSGKTRSAGGMWQLHNIYQGLNDPRVGHATQEDWKDHLARLEKWVAAKPESITARVALADSYLSYGWDARGNETSDTVSSSGWRLFGERSAKARAVLEEAFSLPTKCPEWFLVMQQVAQAQGWEPAETKELFQRAVAFEPGYYYYYRFYAMNLLPKWGGEEGEAERFVTESADQVGGKEGDILYFRVAAYLICPCDEVKMDNLSWPRLQKGFAELEEQYGPSLGTMNAYALLAAKAGDSVTADDTFKRIGDNWDKAVWRKETTFTRYKSWAAELAEADRKFRAIQQEATANVQTPEGQKYKKEVETKLSALVDRCAKEPGGSLEKFEFLVRVAEDGSIENIAMPRLTPVAACLLREIDNGKKKNERPFSPPPRPSYWVDLDLDPSVVNTAAR
jgi:hypothetical protein